MVETIENPTFKPQDFDRSRKKSGISAIVRLRNEEEFLELALDSILPFFDEFVIVYHECADRTPEIVESFANEHPDRVKAYHYLPQVFPRGSTQHEALPPDHASSFVHYCNFALSKATYQIRARWDGDMIAAPEPLGRAISQMRCLRPGTVRRPVSPWRMGFWWFKGVNLWDRDGRIEVVKSWPTSGSRKDHGFFPAGRRHVFRHYRASAYFRWRWLIPRFLGFLFYHVKGMKRDRGIGVFRFDKHPTSLYKERIEERWTDPPLMTLEEYWRTEPAARSLPKPDSLGIRPVR
ncbi:MAG: glycosyltransferase [Anaerolineae bacterium]|jgi:glycosyltransferase involved in cell wall biosynthesis